MRYRFGFLTIATCLLAAAGCATSGTAPLTGPLAATVEAPPPRLPPEQAAEKVEARQLYVSCLRQAARYADENTALSGDTPALIAPMCYPQFSRYEAAAAAGMEGRALRYFDRKGDQLQLDFAAEAIQQQRGLAALSAPQ